jgi:hypothetical protein
MKEWHDYVSCLLSLGLSPDKPYRRPALTCVLATLVLQMSLQRLLSSYDVEHLRSTPVLKSDNFHRPLDKVAASDFFAQSDDSIERLSLRPRRGMAAVGGGGKGDGKVWRAHESEWTRGSEGPSTEAAHRAAGRWGLYTLQLLMPDLEFTSSSTLVDTAVRWVEGGLSVLLLLAFIGIVWSSDGACGKLGGREASKCGKVE